jgi:hypothetical protein
MGTKKENMRPINTKVEDYTIRWVVKYRALDGGIQRVEVKTYEAAKSSFDEVRTWSGEAVLYQKERRIMDTELHYFKRGEEDEGKKSHDNYS